MRTISAVIVICILFTLLGCSADSPDSPCNESLLDRFKGTKQAEYSYNWAIKDLLARGVAKDYGWVISQRDDGCVVTYKATVNSREYEWFHWYIDLKTRTVYPDDSDARTIVNLVGLAPSVLGQ